MARAKANPDFLGFFIKRLDGQKEKIIEVKSGGYKTTDQGAMVKAAFVSWSGRGKTLIEEDSRVTDYAGKDAEPASKPTRKTTTKTASKPATKKPTRKTTRRTAVKPATKKTATKTATKSRKPTTKVSQVKKRTRPKNEHSTPAPMVKKPAKKENTEIVYKFLPKTAQGIRDIAMQAVNEALENSPYTIEIRNGVKGAEVQINNEVGTGGPEMRIMFDIIPVEHFDNDEPVLEYDGDGLAHVSALTLLSDETLLAYDTNMQALRKTNPKLRRFLSTFEVGCGVVMKNSEFVLVGYDENSEQFIVAVLEHKGKSLGSIMRMSINRFVSSCSSFDLAEGDVLVDPDDSDEDFEETEEFDDGTDFDALDDVVPEDEEFEVGRSSSDEDDLEEDDEDDEEFDLEDDLDEEDFGDEEEEDEDFDEDFDDIDDLE